MEAVLHTVEQDASPRMVSATRVRKQILSLRTGHVAAPVDILAKVVNSELAARLTDGAVLPLRIAVPVAILRLDLVPSSRLSGRAHVRCPLFDPHLMLALRALASRLLLPLPLQRRRFPETHDVETLRVPQVVKPVLDQLGVIAARSGATAVKQKATAVLDAKLNLVHVVVCLHPSSRHLLRQL